MPPMLVTTPPSLTIKALFEASPLPNVSTLFDRLIVPPALTVTILLDEPFPIVSAPPAATWLMKMSPAVLAPALTAAIVGTSTQASAQKKYDDFHKWFAANPGNAAEDRELFDRCLFFSQSGPPLVPGNYNNLYQIIQTPGQVTIYSEMAHQTRTVPITKRAMLPKDVTQWMGDSVGHWEGETLVIESSNIRYNEHSHFGTQYDGMTDENLRVTERFTRTAPDMITYQATVVDPTVYTKPWTIELPMEKATGPIFEYACHEGNYGLSGILSGERAKEKEAAAKAK